MSNNNYYFSSELNSVYNYLDVDEVKQYWSQMLEDGYKSDIAVESIETIQPITLAR